MGLAIFVCFSRFVDAKSAASLYIKFERWELCHSIVDEMPIPFNVKSQILVIYIFAVSCAILIRFLSIQQLIWSCLELRVLIHSIKTDYLTCWHLNPLCFYVIIIVIAFSTSSTAVSLLLTFRDDRVECVTLSHYPTKTKTVNNNIAKSNSFRQN